MLKKGNKVKILKSPCDLGKSDGKEGVIHSVIPTARGDGSIWYNIIVDVTDAHVQCWRLAFLEDHLEKLED